MRSRLQTLKTDVRRRIESGDLTAQGPSRDDIAAREVQMRIAHLETKIEELGDADAPSALSELGRELESLQLQFQDVRRVA